MILLSNIIKAEYVLYDSKKECEKVVSAEISSSKEVLYEIYNQRETIIKDATAEALRIVNTAKRNAQSEVEEIKKRANEEGYNAGFEIGKNKGYEEGCQKGLITIREELSKKNETRVNEINSMIELIENEKKTILSKYENEIYKLSIDIAEKILRQKIELKDNFIAKIIESVINDYKNVEWVKIYISSNEDVKMLEADKSLIDELSKISDDIKIEVKKGLANGSCIVETPDNIVDASLDTQLNNLKEILLSK
ncbi:flagellar assembly protein FliH [Sedimentibacter acidaminivorans]|uniref:Flagellar assembly protein FliH n=1 Tax=Sedimentibacter acidaminivorans TaxID=913099 RepID=A0ABS4GDI1_9FIRM|nr:FliH/SctL family protein [Sedimentibacter acidaminivorans]MBP1925753.1 flagellar assembly protein FliH [Sedimentibacter acidaminivorans]